MKKAAGHISVILKGILFIGFSIQIILGIIWMCFNVAHLQQFTQAEGILYRGLRRVCGGNFWILYLLQLGAAYFAADKFLGAVYSVKGFWRVWRNCVLLTFPMAMQCQLAVSPFSLVSSFFLLELSAGIGVVRKREKSILREYALGGFCWLVLTLLLPEYFVLGAVPLVLVLLFGFPVFRKKLRLLGGMLLLLGAFGGMILGSCSLAGEKGLLPDKETIAFSLAGRMSWPTIWVDGSWWPEELYEVMGEVTWETSLYADNMELVFRPAMLENFGEAQAAEYYLKMAEVAWLNRKNVIVRRMGWDILGYGVTPLVLPIQLQGGGEVSYSGRNYEFMMMNTPVLTKHYMGYGCWWFGMLLLLLGMLMLTTLVEKKVKPCGGNVAAVLLCLFSAGSVVAMYTMRGAGVMDYKCTIAVNLLWYAAAVLLMTGECRKG